MGDLLQQVPRVDEIVAPGATALATARPSAAPFLLSGVYGHVLAGWRAQAQVILARLADEVAQSRVPTATADGLAELAASEFDAFLSTAPQKSIGTVGLIRTGVAATKVQKGKRFRRLASTTGTAIPFTECVYEATETTLVAASAPIALVPVQAVQAGAFGNQPAFTNGSVPSFEIVDPLDDATWQPFTSEFAGGTDVPDDDDYVRALAYALDAGRFAPTDGALVAGCLTAGARHIAAIDVPLAGARTVFVADASWAWSERFLGMVERELSDDWRGFGCKVFVRAIRNKLVKVAATVMVDDVSLTSDPSDITADILASLQQYFDDRPDFYTFDIDQIGATICGANRRIITCADVILTEPNGTSVSPEPITPSSSIVTHFYLADDAVTLSYVGPS